MAIGLVSRLVVLTVGIGLVSSPALAADSPKGRKLALLVGVKEYDHAQLPDLQFPENDVEELAEVLRLQRFQVVLLTTKLGQDNESLLPTAANIRAALTRLLAKATKHDVVLVGLAGHGVQPLGSDRAYFCPKDANPTIREAAEKGPSVVAHPELLLGIDELLGTLDESGVGQKLVFVDACRNDPNVRGRRGVDRVKVAALPSETGVLLSCSGGQFAFEHATWGKGGHGAFFAAVIEGIRGRAGNNGAVTWETLAPYVRREVPLMVKKVYGKDGGEQSPNVIANISATPAVLAAWITTGPNRKNSPIRELEYLRAGTAWKGSIRQGKDMFPAIFYVTLRNNYRIAGEIHFQVTGGVNKLTFDGALNDAGKFEWTTDKKAGTPTYPGTYTGGIRGKTLSGEWKVLNDGQYGTFSVTLSE